MEALASIYIPIDRRQALVRGEALPQQTSGAALFADISGFTPLTIALLKELGTKRGPEELTRQLNQVYDALVAEVHRYGGSVMGFAGDAITCWLDGDDGSRAVACGLAMQQAMGLFARVETPAGTVVSLGMKVATVTGPVRRFLIGDPTVQYIDVLAGTTLDRMAAAEHVAERGEVVVGLEVVIELGDLLEIAELRADEESGEQFAVVTALKQAVPANPWPQVDELVLSEEQVRPWLLRPIYERLKGGHGQYLAEVRPAVALFMRFGGIDYDQDPQASQKLDAYIRWVQNVISRYEGFLLQLTLGDKGCYLYAVFGAPIAHEDDPARAAAAAVELQSPPESVSFVGQVQLGISQGRMRAGAYGGRGRCTYGVLGDEVNMAARLMGKTQAGQIMVSDRVALAVAASYELQDLGLIQVKGKEEPIPVSLVLGRKGVSAQKPINFFPTPLVGREEELDRIVGLFNLATAGQGQILRVEGVAGIGKSHLLSEFAQQGLKQAWRVVLGVCQSTSQDIPYFAWQQIFQAFFVLTAGHSAHDDPHERIIARQIAQIEATLGELNPDWLIRLPLLGDLLNFPIPDNPTTAAFDPKLRQEALFTLVIDLIQHWATEQPLLIIIEDAHWLDETSQALTIALSRVAATMPLMLTICHRPPVDEQHPILPELNQQPTYHELNLGDLSQTGVAALVANRLQGQSSALLLDLIQVQARGNPFFVEELTDTLAELGHLVQQEDKSWLLADPIVTALREAHCLTHNEQGQLVLNPDVPLSAADLGLPDSIQGLVLSRMDRLLEEHKLTIKVASVIGRIFEFRLLARSHPVQAIEQALLEQVASIEAREFTRLERSLPNLTYIFKHNITRDVAYETLLEDQQRELHRAVGEAMEELLPDAVEQLAYHFSRAKVTEKARRYLGLAGQKAQREYMNETALNYYHQTLSLEDRWQWRQGQVEVLHILGRREAEQAALVLLEAHSQAPTFEAAYLWGQYYEAISDYPQALAAVERALAASRATGDILNEMRSLIRFGAIIKKQGEYEQAKEFYQQALTLLQHKETYDDQEALAVITALNGLGAVHREQGEFEQARLYHEQALALSRQIGDRRGEAQVFNDLGVTASYQRNFVQALDYYQQALEIQRAIGNRAGEGAALGNLAQVVRDMGDYNQSLDYLTAALSIIRAIGNRWGEVNVLNDLGILYQELGSLSQAEENLQRGLQLAEEIGDEIGQAYLLLNLGLVATDGGQLEMAEQRLNQGIAIAQAQDDKRLVTFFLNYLSTVNLQRSDLEQAKKQAESSASMRQLLDMRLNTTDDLATLAAIHLQANELAQALDYAEQTLALLTECSGNGPEFPQRDYFIGYQVLTAAGQAEPALDALRSAYKLVMDRAGKITQANLRQSFLEKVPTNREILAEVHKLSFADRN